MYTFVSYLPGIDGAFVWLAPVSISEVDRIGVDDSFSVDSFGLCCVVVGNADLTSVDCVVVPDPDTDNVDEPSMDTDLRCDVNVVSVDEAASMEDMDVSWGAALLETMKFEAVSEVS